MPHCMDSYTVRDGCEEMVYASSSLQDSSTLRPCHETPRRMPPLSPSKQTSCSIDFNEHKPQSCYVCHTRAAAPVTIASRYPNSFTFAPTVISHGPPMSSSLDWPTNVAKEVVAQTPPLLAKQQKKKDAIQSIRLFDLTTAESPTNSSSYTHSPT